MSWKLKVFIAVCVVVPLVFGLLLWDAARKEVFFLCENFEPGHSRVDVVRQLETANYLDINTKQQTWGESMTVSSVLHPLTNTCQIEFDQKQQVRFAAVSPLHIQQTSLADQPLYWVGQKLEVPESNSLTLSNPAEVLNHLETEKGIILVSLDHADTGSAKKLRSLLEAEYQGEIRRHQLRRIVVHYPDLCLLSLVEIKAAANYAKDNFAGLAWSHSEQCNQNQQRRLDHQVESTFRQF
ncbi:MAG: hypothetical protein ACE37D_18155 [Pseudomonadales bacterium]